MKCSCFILKKWSPYKSITIYFLFEAPSLFKLLTDTPPPPSSTHTHTIHPPSPEFRYSCGRTSQLWQVSPVAMRTRASDRIRRLSRHKTAPAGYLEHRSQFAYSCGRCSPIWQLSLAAMDCGERPHTTRLAQPKQTHLDYLPSRQVRLKCFTI